MRGFFSKEMECPYRKDLQPAHYESLGLLPTSSYHIKRNCQPVSTANFPFNCPSPTAHSSRSAYYLVLSYDGTAKEHWTLRKLYNTKERDKDMQAEYVTLKGTDMI